MSPVQRAPRPSADSSFISGRARYICSKVPKTRQTDSSSVALLDLLEIGAGNQLAVRIFRLCGTGWTNTPKRLSAHCRGWTSIYHPEAAGVVSEGAETTINKDNLGKLCEDTLHHAEGAIKSYLPCRGGICCGAAQPSPSCQEPRYPPSLTVFQVLPWWEKPFWTWREGVFWVNPVSQVPFTSSKLISNVKAEKYGNSRGNRR